MLSILNIATFQMNESHSQACIKSPVISDVPFCSIKNVFDTLPGFKLSPIIILFEPDVINRPAFLPIAILFVPVVIDCKAPVPIL